MGSTNKIMVALLVLEQAERGKASLEGEVTVSEDAADVVPVLTPRAGSSLVATATAEDDACLSVILDAREARFAASILGLEHGFAAYDRRDLVAGGEKYAEADVPYRRGERG
jgi:D-alanyl-D-alanine carboxypeptidase